jgi:hypothetical protein
VGDRLVAGFICAELDCSCGLQQGKLFPRATIPIHGWSTAYTFSDFFILKFAFKIGLDPCSAPFLPPRTRRGPATATATNPLRLLRQRSTWSMYLWCFDLVAYVHGLMLLAPAVWREIVTVVQFFTVIILVCKIMEIIALP